ncbi:dual specificity phosphatase domain protein (macronuclear) [Tetrahymena thermophila SB210]|uniref:Dual specificity phosphatase domain protein n=1 Tax=Tetrahymena thermophila (strain SB210) TaxID=312017 RepID=Q24BN8_TETTS|nr:dual specificity phosphatase domain protein [Tetrahymena thermophila SB210]EAS05205.2 dual specificity phosphatase domain protein [Tetrahymena thermophila SB210]|eukprot:XP_001025450.2 dual specificity phosphatase domain protein [Tetrahymena thermophila SB210]
MLPKGNNNYSEVNKTIEDDQSQIQLEKEQRTLILISKSSKGYILITQMNIDLENKNIRFLTSFDWQNSKIYIRNSYFYRNKAIQDGGSIYLKQVAPLVTLYNTTFDSCSSGNFGGALYMYQVNATNCTFINNKSKVGGVLFTVLRESNILNSQYINNTASITSPNAYFCPPYAQDRDQISCEIFQIENIFEYNQQLQNTPLYIKEINYTLQTDFNSKNTLSLQAKLMYGIVYIIKLRLNSINFTQYSPQLSFGNVYSYLTQNYQQYFSPFSVPEVNYPYLVVTYVPNLDCQSSNQLIRFDFFQSSFYTPGCFEVSSQCKAGMQQLTSISQEQIFQQCQYCNLGQFLYKTNYSCLTCNPNYYSSCYSNLTFLVNGYWRNELVEDESSIYQCNLNPSNCESENRIGIGNSLCKEGYKGDQCLACDLDGSVWGESYGGTGNKLPQIILSYSLHKNPFIQLLDLSLRVLFYRFQQAK